MLQKRKIYINRKGICTVHISKIFLVIFLIAEGYFCTAQENNFKKNITLKASNIKLENILGTIQKQTGYTFSYNPDDLDSVYVKNINWENTTITSALAELKQKVNLAYSFLGTNISITVNINAKAPAKEIKQLRGSIKGRVVDFETNQPLPGASVQLDSTMMVVVTDEKGFYSFKNIKAGRFKLHVSYIGFISPEQNEVVINDNKELIHDIKMQANSELLTSVTVKNDVKRIKSITYSTEAQIINEIKNGNAVISGISNEQIIKSADRNAAEIVKRISGVTVGDDNLIIVRGMNSRYNVTYLNDNLAPSTEVYSRAFAYDLIPTNVIDRILVYKSPSPDLFGDFAGGAIKVFTKNAKPVRHFEVGAQVGYRPQSQFADGYGYKGGKYDWLGVDDGGRQLPEIIGGYLKKEGNNALTQQEYVKAFNPDLQIQKQKVNRPDLQLFTNYFNSFKIGQGRIFNLSSLTYQNETRHVNVRRQVGLLNPGGPVGGLDNSKNSLSTDDQTNGLAKINLLQNFTYKIDRRTTLYFNNFFLNEGNALTSRTYTEPNTFTPELLPEQDYGKRQRIVLSYKRRFLYTGNLDGGFQLGRNANQNLHVGLGYSYSRQTVPDQRVINYFQRNVPVSHRIAQATGSDEALSWTAAGSNAGGQADLFQGMISRIFTRSTESLYSGSADYHAMITKRIGLKAGMYQAYRLRELGRRFFRVNRAGLDLSENDLIENPPASGGTLGMGQYDANRLLFKQQDIYKIWSSEYLNDNRTALQVYDATNPTDSYIASEQTNAAYLMSEWSVLPDLLSLSGGLRVEYDRQKISGAVSQDGAILPVFVNKSKTILLPSVNAIYNLRDSILKLRAGYGRTINRPEFREISPYQDYDFQNAEAIDGNPGLKDATIDNIELRLELYPGQKNQNEAITLGGFYKRIASPIERIKNDSRESIQPFPVINFRNAERATIYGFEIEVRKNLSFIPAALFRNFSIIANGALIKSEAVRQEAEGTDTSLSAKKGPLQGQSPYMINAGLYYENPGWGTKIGLIYNVSGPSIYAVSYGNTVEGNALVFTRPNVLQLPQSLMDVSLTQRIIKRFQARLNIQNILNKPFRLIEDNNYDNHYQKVKAISGGTGTINTGDNLYREYYSQRYFTLNLSYSF